MDTHVEQLVSIDSAGATSTGPSGQRAHRDLLAHTDRLEQKLWNPRPGVWCLVGNGLSNQTFIEAPDGLIAIDTGESVEEMSAAIAAVRAQTDRPIVAVIYTHYHYVAGTAAVFEDGAAHDIEIYSHARLVPNRRANASEVSAAAGRGLIHQFGISLPAEGPDALANVGLGLAYRKIEHAPFTPGFVEPTVTFDDQFATTIAGLRVEMISAPSDANDSITIWFPDLSVCVNNIIWPTLFNIFAIRGEEYRDPHILLTGIDHVRSLGAEHLVGAHGPPLSGAAANAELLIDYRDSIQFLWDQTVRGINRGLTTDELTHFVQLPERFGRTYLTRQWYGLVEHHVRQIHAGLRGWFDGDEANLLPTEPAERCRRLIEGFGGPDVVRSQARAALDADDPRWAIELASWLVRTDVDDAGRIDGGSPQDRRLLAEGLRVVAQRTTASNVRNWCLTRALELENALDLRRHRVHRFSVGGVLAAPPEVSVHSLRVLLDPARCEGQHQEIRFEFESTEVTGLRLRDGVAIPTDGADADQVIGLSFETWARLLAGKLTLSEGLDAGLITTDGDADVLRAFFSCFDHAALGQ